MAYYFQNPGSSVPSNALLVGKDKDGGQIYVGRAYFKGDLLPAKVVPNHGVAYVAYNGQEHVMRSYEVLCLQSGHALWTYNNGGRIPSDAVECGRTSDGETLYIGRVFHDGTMTPGKIHPGHKCCYIPYDGKELSFTNYEVLTIE